MGLHHLRDNAVPPELVLDPQAQGVRRMGLTVHDERLLRRPAEARQPAQDFVGVGVGRQHLQVLDLGMDRDPRVPAAWKPENRMVLRRSGP